MKNWIALLLALLLCLGAGALAEQVEGPLFESDYLKDSPVEGGDIFIYTDYRTGEGLVTVDGQKLCEPIFGGLYWKGYDYFEAINDNGLDTHGLIDKNGNEILPFKYSAFQVYSPTWAGAVTLTPITEGNGDYGGGFFGTGEQYNIEHVDIYRLPEGTLVGTLDRDSFKDARSVGKGEFLLVRDRNDGLSMYNARFEKLDHMFERFGDPEVVLRQANSISPIEAFFAATGEKLEGLKADQLTRLDRHEDKYILVRGTVTVNMQKAIRYGLMTVDGEVVLEPVLPDINGLYQDRYVLASEYRDDDLYYGVYDLESQQLIVPIEYNRINFENGFICFKGYFRVEKDGKMGYVDSENNVTCPLEYAEESVEDENGACFVVREGDALKLAAADGVVTDLTALGVVEVRPLGYGADGSYISVVNADGANGIMDWHGNFIVEFSLPSTPTVYRDGYVKYDGDIFHIG